MDEDSTAILQSLGRSSAIIFTGVILELFISLLAKIFIANVLPRTSYGEVAIGLITLTAFGIVARLGLDVGVTRNAVRYENAERRGVLVSSYILGIGSATIFASTLYFTRRGIAGFLGNPDLAPVLAVTSLGIPALVLTQISMGAIRAANRSSPKVLVQNITNPVTRLVLLIVLVGTGSPPALVMIAYISAHWFAAVVALIFAWKYTTLFEYKLGWTPQFRSMISFSTPLMVSGGLLFLLGNTDTVMVQYFFDSGAVAVYDIAYLVGQTLTFFSGSVAYLFLPKMSNLESEERWDDVDHIYKLVTKWVLFATLPLYILFALFSKNVLILTFGTKYADGALLLSIVATTYLVRAGFGPNKGLLSATGDTRYIMWTNLLTVMLNFVLNIVLLITIGVIGAAIASLLTFSALNCGYNMRLYRDYGVHPFSRSMLKPTAVFLVFTAATVRIFRWTVDVSLVSLVILAIGLGVLYPIVLLLFGGVQTADIELLNTAEDSMNVDLSPIKDIARKLL